MCSVQSGSWIIKLNKLYCLWKVGTHEVQGIDWQPKCSWV